MRRRGSSTPCGLNHTKHCALVALDVNGNGEEILVIGDHHKMIERFSIVKDTTTILITEDPEILFRGLSQL